MAAERVVDAVSSWGQLVGPDADNAGNDAGSTDEVQELRLRKVLLNQQRKALSKQLRNEQRKRQRLKERAKKLSNADLVRVLAERESLAKAKAKPKAKSRASAAGRP